MTMLAGAAPRTLDAGRLGLADAGLRRRLTSLLRQRVPASEAEDLAQTVLCDALASARIPSDPDELRRWVTAIARNKVADHHRRARRVVLGDEAALESLSVVPDVEARDLLAEVVESGARASRDPRTLGWLVREHEGERLCDIASEEGLPATVVRQRVSRLRRALRDRYGALLALLLVVGGAFSASRAAVTRGHDAPAAAIVADATGDADRVLVVLQGRWAITDLRLDAPSRERLEPAERLFVDHATAASVEVRGARLAVVVPATGATSSRTLRVLEVGDGAAALAVEAADGRVHPAAVTWSGERVVVRFDDGRLSGVAVLTRR